MQVKADVRNVPELQVRKGASFVEWSRIWPVQVQSKRVDHVGYLLAGLLVILESYNQGLSVERKGVQVELCLEVSGEAIQAIIQTI